MVDFIRKAKKSTLLAVLRKADKLTPRLLAKILESFLSKDEYETFSAAGGIDHGALTGLADNDHTQYTLHSLADAASDFLVASGANAFVKKTLAETGAILEADLDHGNIQGLADDDHTRYLDKDGTRALTGDWFAGAARKITVGAVSAGASNFGDGGATNYAEFEADGTLKFNGTAKVWDDLRGPVNAVRVGPAGAPDFSQFKDDGGGSTGVFAFWFDSGTEQQVYFSAQLPHTYAEGTNIEPHVHWVSADTAGGSGTDVCWGLEYTWANINGTFGNTAIIYADEQSNGSGETITVDKHYYTDFAAISGTGKTISSMLVCRLFRDATGTGGTDDYDDDAGLLEFDFHFEIDTVGSRAEITK